MNTKWKVIRPLAFYWTTWNIIDLTNVLKCLRNAKGPWVMKLLAIISFVRIWIIIYIFAIVLLLRNSICLYLRLRQSSIRRLQLTNSGYLFSCIFGISKSIKILYSSMCNSSSLYLLFIKSVKQIWINLNVKSLIWLTFAKLWIFWY